MKKTTKGITKLIAVLLIYLFYPTISFGQISSSDIEDATEIIKGIQELLEPLAEPTPVAAPASSTQFISTTAAPVIDESKRKEDLAVGAFKRDYLTNYLKYAEDGNQAYRMFLVYGLYETKNSYCHCDIGYLVPNWKSWMKEAIRNNYLDAINFVGYNSLYSIDPYNLELTPSQGLLILEKAGNAELMNAGVLGVNFINMSDSLAQAFHIQNREGVFVRKIVPKSAALAAGFIAQDVIVKINNTAINSNQKLLQIIAEYKAGDTLKVEYYRNDLLKEKQVVLKRRDVRFNQADAMLVLAEYYNGKKSLKGGEDAEKALYWYKRATQLGSPSAMYILGHIYLYNTSTKLYPNYFVKYKIDKDEKLALTWFLKSVEEPTYEISNFKKYVRFSGSCFRPESYDELIKMYQYGIGCEKNPTKAAQYTAIKDDYLLQLKLAE